MPCDRVEPVSLGGGLCIWKSIGGCRCFYSKLGGGFGSAVGGNSGLGYRMIGSNVRSSTSSNGSGSSTSGGGISGRCLGDSNRSIWLRRIVQVL